MDVNVNLVANSLRCEEISCVLNLNKMPALGALKYFKAAAGHLSFKLASEELFVTQAAIANISRLLRISWVASYLSEKGEVQLTPQGQILLCVQKVSRDPTRLVATGRRQSSQCSQNYGVTFYCHILVNFHGCICFARNFQELQVKLIPDPSVVNYDNFNLDLAIRYGVGEYENLESRYLFSDRVFLVSHPSLVRKSMLPKDLMELPVITENYEDTRTPGEVFESESDVLQAFKNKFEIRDATPAMVGAILAGQGIAMARQSLVQDYLKNGQLVKLFDFEHRCQRSYYIAAPEYHFSFPKVQAFEKWLREAASDLIASSD